MRTLLTAAAGLVAIGLLADVSLAHGGQYLGPNGGGAQTFGGAIGGGNTPGPGNPGPGVGGGGTTPGNSGGGTTPNPSGPPPVRPGGGRGGGRGTSARGGTTPGAKKSAGTSTTSWDIWWEFNDDRFLNLKKKVRELAQASDNSDTFLGAVTGDANIAKVTTDQIRRDIIPTLKIALKDSFYDARAGAIIALGKVGDASQQDIVDAIRERLKDEDKTVQESACLGLGILGSKDSIPSLLEIAKNSTAGKKLVGSGTGDILTRTRAFAAIAVGLIGTREDLDKEVVADLISLATTKSKQIDEQVGPALALQLLRTQDAVPQLIEIFNDPEVDRYVRAHIGVALGKMGAKTAVGTLVDGLENKVNVIQYSSAIALGLLTEKDDKATVAKLIRYAEGASDRATRNFCMIALGEIGNAKGQAFLLQQARNGKNDDQTFAAIALGVMGFKHNENKAEVGQEILSLYEKERSDSQKAAMAISLGLLSYEPAKEILRKDLEGPGNQALKTHVVTALGLLVDKDAIPAIKELVRQRSDLDLRKSAAIALGLLRDSTAVETLQHVIEESGNSKAVLGAATVALGYIGDRKAVPILKDFVENPNKTHQDVTRAFATVALGFLGDRDDIPLLSKVHEHSNFLAHTDALGEILSIL